MAKSKPTRDQKARLLFNGGVRPIRTGPDAWTVHASSCPGVYEVRRDAGQLSCSCPDFARRGDPCKHILLTAQVEGSHQVRTCGRYIEARHNGVASYSAGCHVWCGHSRALVEPEKKKGCASFIDRAELIIV
jgi:hypothetical protein